jgi:hypothetical protein
MRFLAPVIVAAVMLAAAGCGSSSDSAEPPATQTRTTTAKPAEPAPAPKPSATSGKCVSAPGTLIDRISRNVVLDGAQLVEAEAVASPAIPGIWFVTARVRGGGAANKLATWMTASLESVSPIYAVDGFAALISTYGGAVGKSAGLTVDAPGVYRSRVCVAGPNAPHGVTAPLGGGARGSHG